MQTEHITSHNCKQPADPCLREDSGACNHAVVAQSTCGSDTYLSHYNYHKSNDYSYYDESNPTPITSTATTMSATTTATPPTTIATTITRKNNNYYTKDWNLHNFKYTRHKY